MPEFTTPVPGRFCWLEVLSTDPVAATKFYTSLFGWGTNEMPMPDGSLYRIAHVGGKFVGGIMQLPEPAKQMGAPPHWNQYVAVEDVHAASKKAADLGAKVLVGPMDLPTGALATLMDPAGAVFSLWQQKQSMGTWIYGEIGSLGWNELSTTNVDAAGKFYASLFGWKPEAQQMGDMTYTTFKVGDAYVGGMMAQPKEMAGAPSAWTAYFSVADADATLAKATSLGAKALSPLMDVPTVGRFGFVADPQGAAFAIIKFAAR